MRNFLPLFAVALVACIPSAPSGPLAPPFQGKGSAVGPDGRPQNFSMLDITKTRMMLVVFFHVDSKNGLEAAKALRPWQEKHATEIQVLGVTTVPQLNIEAFGMQHPDVVQTIGDMDRTIIARYKVTESPTFVLIDRGGVLKGTFAGNKEGVEQLVSALPPKLQDLPRGPWPSDRSMADR